jgi:transposase
MVQLGELMMILELHRQGLSVTAIARWTGRDPKTVRKYIERGVEAPAYRPRSVGHPSGLAPFIDFLRERVVAFPDQSAARLTREIRELGYAGAYTPVKRFLAAIRPENGPKPYEVRFETSPGLQAQVDFARFVVDFAGDPRHQPCRLAVQPGARALALPVRALRSASGPADATALPHPGLRGAGRGADRDPL